MALSNYYHGGGWPQYGPAGQEGYGPNQSQFIYADEMHLDDPRREFAYRGSGMHFKRGEFPWVPWNQQNREPLGVPSGTGSQFLSGAGLHGRRLDDPGEYIDPAAGGPHRFTGPFLQAAFLRGEMGPGGYLSKAEQNLGLARGITGIAATGRTRARELIASLTGSGVNAALARGAARDVPVQTGQQATQMMAQGRSGIDEMRFDATHGLVNAIVEAGDAGKTSRLQADIARQSAEATKDAGKSAGIGSFLGPVAGGLISLSDEREKEDITPIGGALAKLRALRGASWRWKKGGTPAAGVIAQDVRNVMPEGVLEDGDGKLYVDYAAVIGLLVQGLNEVSAA